MRSSFSLCTVWLGVCGLSACSDALLQPPEGLPTNVDNRLTLKGRVCTRPPEPNGFPVKVLFIVDQSGSMCVSDPPGSQEGSGFCEQAAVAAIVPPGVTEPSRVRALKQLLAQFQGQPNVKVALEPFESNVKGVWPACTTCERFATPDSDLDMRVSRLQSELGKGTDYQGALAYAYGLVAEDITYTEQHNPAELPRTRYVVVFLTDGTPFPRCASVDNLPRYADNLNPELTWADSSGSGNFCNTINDRENDDPNAAAISNNPPDSNTVYGFKGGTDRNQNYQLFAYADHLMELRKNHNIGGISLHTVLLFNEEAVRACGPICQDLYGTYPNVSTAQYPLAAHDIARYTLRALAEKGNGIYQEFNNFAEIGNLGLGFLNYTSLASRNVMKNLLVQQLTGVPGPKDRLVDSDGDGLKDDLDNSFSFNTSPYTLDSDGDCFDDNFEVSHAAEGFRTDVKDSRGCDPASPLTPRCVCADTDGDGLSQYAESYLKSNPTLVDTDGDGLPDGIEVRYGLDPVTAQAPGLDTDGDNLSDAQEIRADTNPISRDGNFYDDNAYQYETRAETQADDRICYDFSVSNLEMVTPPNRAGLRQGYNLYKLYFGEAPESGAATDYGVWRAACAWAEYDPPSVRVPQGPDLTLADNNFVAPAQLADLTRLQGRCVGTPP